MSFAAVVEAAEDREAAYGRLLDELSRLYPSLLPASAIWGFGRPLWNSECRMLGMRPLRCAHSQVWHSVPALQGCRQDIWAVPSYRPPSSLHVLIALLEWLLMS